MSGPPDYVVMIAETFVFYASLSSGIRHFILSIRPVAVDGLLFAEILIVHDEPPKTWCYDCGKEHQQILLVDSEFTFDSPPMPDPDKVFINPDPGWIIDPEMN